MTLICFNSTLCNFRVVLVSIGAIAVLAHPLEASNRIILQLCMRDMLSISLLDLVIIEQAIGIASVDMSE